MPKDGSSQVAYCAEYNSENDEEDASTRRHATGPAVPEQANITAKRTTDAQGPTSSSPRQNSQDVASDSGYSSRTQTTSASADSGKSATALPPATMDAKTTTAATDGGSHQTLPHSSKPALSQVSSKGSRKGRKCQDPDCAECKRGRMKMAADSAQKSASRSPKGKPDETTRSASKSRSQGKAPSTTSKARPQPQVRPPLRSASTTGPRPRSVFDPSREPRSAGPGPFPYWNAPYYPYYAQGYMTGAGNMMVADRPGLPYRLTDTSVPSARTRALNAGGTPFVSYDPGANQRLSARHPTKNMYPAVGYEQDDYEDEYEDEDKDADADEDADEGGTAESAEYGSPEERYKDMMRKQLNEYHALEAQKRAEALQREEDAKRMPPPQQPASAGPQPTYSMRSYDASATNVTYGDRNNGYDDFQNTAGSFDLHLSGRPSRARRTSLASSGDRSKGTSASQPIPGSQKVTIQDPRARPQSFYGGEDLDELIAKQLQALQLGRDGVLQTHPLRRNPGGSNFKYIHPDLLRYGSERDDRPTHYEKLSEEALAYQRLTDRLRPLESVARHMRRNAGLPSEDEDPWSPAPSNVSNDGSARINPRRQSKVIPSDRMSAQDGEVRMRFDLSNEFQVEFEGHRLAIAPTGEGSIAELVIGGPKREGTSTYGTSKGSTTESRHGKGSSTRTKEPTRKAERDQPPPARFRQDPELGDDERNTTTAAEDLPKRGPRTKRAETYGTTMRRAVEEPTSDSDPAKPTRPQHRRTKTHDVRYDAGPPSPAGTRGRRSFVGRP